MHKANMQLCDCCAAVMVLVVASGVILSSAAVSVVLVFVWRRSASFTFILDIIIAVSYGAAPTLALSNAVPAVKLSTVCGREISVRIWHDLPNGVVSKNNHSRSRHLPVLPCTRVCRNEKLASASQQVVQTSVWFHSQSGQLGNTICVIKRFETSVFWSTFF